jgi:23S rRNA pseudouridine1911/1915/1917 synthase
MTKEELFEHYEITVDPKQDPLRIDKFLMDRLPNVTRNRLQKAMNKGYVLVNGEEIKPNYKVSPGDVIKVNYPEKPKLGKKVEGEEIPLDIHYEDDDILIVNKEAGMVVHPGIGNFSGTLVHALVHYLQNTDLPVMPGNLADRPGIVHRIDKDTSGLLVIAKNENAMSTLSKQFKDHSVKRSYQAIVWGEPEESKGTINSYIGRHPTNRVLYASYDDPEEGKEAITHFELLEGLYYVSLIECRLETGRTHQIRVHMDSIGHTIFNDHRYGGNHILKGTVFSKYKRFVENCFDILTRQGLHAASLGFKHPRSGKQMHFTAPLPNDMSTVMEKWRHYVSYQKSLNK